MFEEMLSAAPKFPSLSLHGMSRAHSTCDMCGPPCGADVIAYRDILPTVCIWSLLHLISLVTDHASFCRHAVPGTPSAAGQHIRAGIDVRQVLIEFQSVSAELGCALQIQNIIVISRVSTNFPVCTDYSRPEHPAISMEQLGGKGSLMRKVEKRYLAA